MRTSLVTRVPETVPNAPTKSFADRLNLSLPVHDDSPSPYAIDGQQLRKMRTFKHLGWMVSKTNSNYSAPGSIEKVILELRTIHKELMKKTRISLSGQLYL